MDDKFQIFSEQYHKLLELVEDVDEDLAKQYEKLVSMLPKKVVCLMGEYKEFNHEEGNYKASLNRFHNMVEFEYILEGKNKPFVATNGFISIL